MPSSSSKPPFETRSATLITGACSGVAQYLAREFAGNGHPVVLVAQHLEDLDEVAESIRGEISSPIYTLGCDLREPGAASEVNQWMFTNGIMLGVLVNVAGTGRAGSFKDVPVDEDIHLLRLNLEATLRLTKLIIPFFMQTGGGRILNVAPSSLREMHSQRAVYEAMAAFIESWSRSLDDELAESRVTVTFFRPEADFVPEAMHDTVWQGAQDAASIEARQAYRATMEGRRSVTPLTRRSAPPFASASQRVNPVTNIPTTMKPPGMNDQTRSSD